MGEVFDRVVNVEETFRKLHMEFELRDDKNKHLKEFDYKACVAGRVTQKAHIEEKLPRLVMRENPWY